MLKRGQLSVHALLRTMPYQSLRQCTYPGCYVLVKSGRCATHTEQGTIRDPEVKKLYNSKRWQTIRVAQLSNFPWCAHCMNEGKHVIASEVHHIERHQGDPDKFFNGPFESLCKPCHSAETAKEVGWH